MPVIGSSAYNTAGQVATLIQSLLNDPAGNLFAIAAPGSSVPAGKVDLLPYINSAYRKVQRALANIGAETLLIDNMILTVTALAQADPSVQVVLNDTSTPQLPTDLIQPLKLWERASGTTDNFVEMTDVTAHGGLPSRPQSNTLSIWEWRSDGIYLLGALQNVDVRIRYRKAYPDLSDSSGPILIRNAQEPIAFLAAAMAGMARGSPLAEKYDVVGEDALEDLIASYSRRDQQTVHRRRPYSFRAGYRPIL